jgi:hypothetical protein
MNDEGVARSKKNVPRVAAMFTLALIAGAGGMMGLRWFAHHAAVAPIKTPVPPAEQEDIDKSPPKHKTPQTSPDPAPPSPEQAKTPDQGPVAPTAAPGRSAEMKAFDKALLFLIAQQEKDGHWSAEKSGAAREYSGTNGDICVTALSTYALMCAIQGKSQNPNIVGAVKHGVDWLIARLRKDGGIADEAGPGEAVAAQMFSAMVMLQAATMSSREDSIDRANTTTRYAIVKMAAKTGGFGAKPGSEQARMDITALAIFLYRSGLMDGIDYSTASANEQENLTFNLALEDLQQAALKKMRVHPDKKDGVFSMTTDSREPDFDATLSAMLAQVLGNLPPPLVTPGFEYLLGKPDQSGAYPGPGERYGWGKSGEGFRALPTWLGTMAFVFFGDRPNGQKSEEFKAWNAAFGATVLGHQSADGSWDAAGLDAKYGRVWRTALIAFSLVLINPPPPPPQPAATPDPAAAP